MNLQSFYPICFEAAIKASEVIIDIYDNHKINIEYKADKSPVTQADFASNKILIEYLSKTNLPILSEEGKSIPYEERNKWEYFWLIDPLDGTKEFINKNGDFTINIALIYKGKPILGIVYTPVHKELYFGDIEKGAFYIKNTDDNIDTLITKATKLNPENTSLNKEIRVVASRSHLSEETQSAIEFAKKNFDVSFKSRGSSLKLCLLASGLAEYYPRFSPTMEWDTAAGQAILIASGGEIIETETLQEVHYNKENLLNPFFYAFSANILDKKKLLII